MQSTFWINNPCILFNTNSIREIWPNKDMTIDEKFNSITRLILVMTFLGYIINKNYKVIVAGVATILAIVILNYTKHSIRNKVGECINKQEGFSTLNKTETKGNTQPPDTKNPMMNILLPQIQDNPTRYEAEKSYTPETTETINKKTQEMIVNNFDNTERIHERLFRDLGDNFEFDRSMNHFNSNAITTIPNDQKSFAEFCYGDMISCKEGHALACTQSMPQHWIG